MLVPIGFFCCHMIPMEKCWPLPPLTGNNGKVNSQAGSSQTAVQGSNPKDIHMGTHVGRQVKEFVRFRPRCRR